MRFTLVIFLLAFNSCVSANKMEAVQIYSDDELLEYNGRRAHRDIVQFVPYRNFLGCGNLLQMKAKLAKEVLEEVPGQVTSYMFANKIKPGEAPPAYHTNGPTNTFGQHLA